jgi:hypothetical protein
MQLHTMLTHENTHNIGDGAEVERRAGSRTPRAIKQKVFDVKNKNLNNGMDFTYLARARLSG